MKVAPVDRKRKASLNEHVQAQKYKNRVPRDKQTLLTGDISKITVDLELSCALNKKASDTLQTSQQTSVQMI